MPVEERAYPHSLEAERSVLGAVLINSEAFNHAAEILKPDDFYREAHRQIFAAMAALNERAQAVDLITLKEALSRGGQLDNIGGPAYIASLIDGMPRSTNVAYYSRIVKEKATLRLLILSANKILSDAFEGSDDADLILDRAEEQIFSIAENRAQEGFVPMRTLAMTGMEAVQKAYERKQLVTGVPTGFVELDEITSGLQPSDLVIIAARPSMGKTSLALNIAQHVGLKTDMTVGIFSLEMSKEQLFLRMLTSEAGIDSHRLRTGFLVESDWSKLSHAISTLAETSIYIDDTPAIGLMSMRAKARRLQAEHGLHLLIVDYLQLMQATSRFDNRTQELGAISRSLKSLAKELNIPVVALSQLSRAPEARSDHRPMLSDLRESGALEQDADVVAMIFRADAYPEFSPEDEGVAEVIIAKQRNGPTGVVRLAFLKQFTRFASLETRQHS